VFQIRICSGRVGVTVLVWLFLVLTALSIGCNDNDGARVVGPTGPPSLLGQWKGTMTAVTVSGTDTLLVRVFKMRIRFEDSTFSYRYVDNYGITIDPYSGSGTYERLDTLVYLRDTTVYADWVDRTMTPITDEPYRLTLDRTYTVLFWTHDYGGAIVRNQRLDLKRDN